MQDLLRHEALPYDGPGQFTSSCVSVVRDGLESEKRLIVLARSDRLDAVRELLGEDAEDVTFVPVDEHGRNPGRVLTLLHGFQAVRDGRDSVGVSESVLRGRSSAALAEYWLTEAVYNEAALRTWPLSIVCLFDNVEMDANDRRAMLRSHGVVRGHDTNVDFEPDLAQSIFTAEVPVAPRGALRLQIDKPVLGPMRSFVRRVASREGVAADRVDDLVLAANEIVTNSLRHGGGHADLAMWTADNAVVCEVRDGGWITDPLVGKLTPPAAATSGRGIWLANHLCDLVELRSSARGNVVRMSVDC